MKRANSIFTGNCIVKTILQTVQGDIAAITNEDYYKISKCDLIPPFFINIIIMAFIKSNKISTQISLVIKIRRLL